MFWKEKQKLLSFDFPCATRAIVRSISPQITLSGDGDFKYILAMHAGSPYPIPREEREDVRGVMVKKSKGGRTRDSWQRSETNKLDVDNAGGYLGATTLHSFRKLCSKRLAWFSTPHWWRNYVRNDRSPKAPRCLSRWRAWKEISFLSRKRERERERQREWKGATKESAYVREDRATTAGWSILLILIRYVTFIVRPESANWRALPDRQHHPLYYSGEIDGGDSASDQESRGPPVSHLWLIVRRIAIVIYTYNRFRKYFFDEKDSRISNLSSSDWS